MPSRKSGQMRSQTTPFPEMPHQVPGGVQGVSAWLMGKPSQQEGFCLWAFVSLNPGEFNGGEVCLLTALPARPWVSPTHWGLRAASFSQSLEVMTSLKRREASTCKEIKNLRK